MSNPTDIKGSLDALAEGTDIKIKLNDGTEVTGTFQGVDGEKVQIDGADQPVELDQVETFRMDVSSAGPE